VANWDGTCHRVYFAQHGGQATAPPSHPIYLEEREFTVDARKIPVIKALERFPARF
jgi:hypothetical protein